MRCATRPTLDTPQEHVCNSCNLKNKVALSSPNASTCQITVKEEEEEEVTNNIQQQLLVFVFKIILKYMFLTFSKKKVISMIAISHH